MHVLGKRGGIVVLCAWFLSANMAGQRLILKDTLIVFTLANATDPGVSPVRFRLAHDLEYSLSSTALFFSNWQQGDHASLVSLLHHLKYHAQFTNDRTVQISNLFIHDLGIQYFLDSIARFQPDENTLDTRFEFRLAKNLTFTAFSNLTTRMFNSYRYAAGPAGTLLKSLSSSFLTPLLWTFSNGFGWTFPKLGTLSLGLAAAKFTWICNREIYNQQKINEFYGVPKNKNHVFEYGFSLHLQVDKDFLQRVHWNCDLLIFKNYRKPVDLVMKNLIGIRINRFLRTSIQTRLRYEKEVSKSIQVENLVSLGFFIQL